MNDDKSDWPSNGSTWQHRNGRRYRVLCIARMEATGRYVAVYQALPYPDEPPWVRPLGEFMDGRFTEVKLIDGRFIEVNEKL